MKTYNKRPQLIEKAQREPMLAIQDVFASDPRHLFYLLKHWMYIAVTTDHYAYDAPDQRRIFLSFYESLQVLIAALDILHSDVTDKQCNTYFNSADVDYDKYYLLTREQANNPKQVIETFFNQYSIQYTRRELADWLEAGIDFEVDSSGGITHGQIYSAYKDISCLIEASYYLIQQEIEDS